MRTRVHDSSPLHQLGAVRRWAFIRMSIAQRLLQVVFVRLEVEPDDAPGQVHEVASIQIQLRSEAQERSVVRERLSGADRSCQGVQLLTRGRCSDECRK